MHKFVCLYGVSRPTREFFTHMETSPLPVNGCKFWSYARYSWPLSSEGSLACYTYCDTEHPFIMIISVDSWHSHLLPSVWHWSCHYLYGRFGSFADGIWTLNLPLARRTLSLTATPRRSTCMKKRNQEKCEFSKAMFTAAFPRSTNLFMTIISNKRGIVWEML